MNELFKNMFSYIRDGNYAEQSRVFAQELSCDDALSLRTMSINILRWAKLEYKRTLWIQQGRPAKHKPMQLSHEHYPWEDYLRKLMSENNEFQRLFTLHEDALYFSDKISTEEQEAICKFAYQNFNPAKIT